MFEKNQIMKLHWILYESFHVCFIILLHVLLLFFITKQHVIILPDAVWSGHKPIYLQPIRCNQISAKWGTSSWRKEPLHRNVKILHDVIQIDGSWTGHLSLHSLAIPCCSEWCMNRGLFTLMLILSAVFWTTPCTCNFCVNEYWPSISHYISCFPQIPFVGIPFLPCLPFQLVSWTRVNGELRLADWSMCAWCGWCLICLWVRECLVEYVCRQLRSVMANCHSIVNCHLIC